jgi:hypothetical protein
MLRRLVPALVTCIVVVPAVQVLAPTARVAADNGLGVRSTTTYTVDPTAGVVSVVVELTLTNNVPDKRTSTGVLQYYFSGFSVPAPAGAIGAAAATSAGRALTVTPRFLAGNTEYYSIDIDFGRRLFYGQSTNIVVTYDITGRAPRSQSPSRVNRAYASFTAFGVGDEGLATVRVRVPRGFEVETFGGDATVTSDQGYTVYTASDIPDPYEFDLFVSARNDSALDSTDVSTDDGAQFVVRSWPNDPDWTEFVSRWIRQGVPALGELIGQPWPIDDQVEVRQAYTPYLYGYAGWFSALDDEIEIGEDLDLEVVLHELSHAWFNSEWFAERWINEGFAQAYATRAAESLGESLGSPTPPKASDPILFPLNEWGTPDFVDGADESEDYGYQVSWFVVDRLIAEIGTDAMREVLAHVADHTIAYAGDGPPESDVRYKANWHAMLDLLEEIGGSEQATELFRQYVVASGDAGDLDARDEARTAYHALVDAGGDWAPPLVVRDRMAVWTFTAAQRHIDEANAVLATRDELATVSSELGVAIPPQLEQQYEAADRDLTAADAAVHTQLDAAEHLLAAVHAEQSDDGLFARLGLAGTDLPSLLDEGRAALAAGDTELAIARADEVTRVLERAPDVGKQRALFAGGAAFLVVLLLGSLVVLRRRRRRRRLARAALSEADHASNPSSDPAAPGDAAHPDAFEEFQTATVGESSIAVWSEAVERVEPEPLLAPGPEVEAQSEPEAGPEPDTADDG